MNPARLPETCLRLGILYLLIGMALGAFMGMQRDFLLHAVHAHFNLLGFASTFLIGLFLKAYPAALKLQLMVRAVLVILVAVPVLLALLPVMYLGHPEIEPVLGITSLVILAGYVMFAVALFRVTAQK